MIATKLEQYITIGRNLVVRVLLLGGLLGIAVGIPLYSETCGPFLDWETSDYVLPYPVGANYAVVQGNCSGFGHSNFHKHGYDFATPIGVKITASRAGKVFQIRDISENGDTVPGRENWVKIIHDDGNISVYSHLSPGILVTPGQEIEVGQWIGISGNTGNTGGFPHLHFHLTPCSEPTTGCGTLPVTFRNTRPNPSGLDSGTGYEDLSQAYRAMPYIVAESDFLGGSPIDGNPGWNSSPWYLNYNVDFWPWIYHDEHGWQFVIANSSEGEVFLWDFGLSQWLFFNENTYRWMFLFGDAPGWVWTFPDNTPQRRFFQKLDDGSLFSVPEESPVANLR